MTILDLQRIADDENIKVDNFKMNACKSLSLIDDDNNCYIALNDTENALERFAHELGHCLTGAFYNRYAKCDIKAKSEYKANKWAIKKLVPADELKRALKKGYNVFELSDYFNVSESLIEFAYNYYKNNAYLN
jgi:Zn-dependent peptidase ImmA (M78 family)